MQLDSRMKKLFFLGGEDILRRDSKQINSEAFASAGGTPAVLIFPWTAESIDKADRYRKAMVDYFGDLGARAIEFAEYSDSLEQIAAKVSSSDLIYLPGGVTTILVERIKRRNVDSLLRRFNKVIVGNSAGASALCRECIVTEDKDNPVTVIISGLGLVGFSVDVHYDSSKDNELNKLSEKRSIYAIPECCALVYSNDDLSSIGDVYLFHHGRKTRFG
jgi:dipeptidase E